MAQIKFAAQTAQNAKGNTDAQLEATTTNFAEPTPETQALLATEQPKSDAPEKVAAPEQTHTEVADEIEDQPDEIESESSDIESESEEDVQAV